jgi:HSP20 family protein
MFQDFFQDSWLQGGAGGVFPAWNVAEDDKSFHVEAELPGFSQEDLEIKVAGGELHLSGMRDGSQQDEKASYHRRERFSGKFSRTLRFGVPIDVDKVAAKFVDGVLTVTLPKAEAALPRKIRVAAS